METKNMNTLIAICMTLVVGVILTGSLLMPIINDVVAGEEDTFTNGTNYVTYYTDDATLVASSTGLTLDGEAVTARSGNYVLSDNFEVIGAGGTNYISYKGASTLTSLSNATYTITITDGSAVINNGDTDVATVDCPGIYIYSDEETDIVSSLQGTDRYINTISDIFRGQLIDGVWYCLKDGVLYADGVETAYTVTSGITADEDYTNLSTTGGNLVLTLTDSSTSITLNYGYIVPESVTATVKDSVPDSGIIALYLAIPVLVIVGLLMVAVSAIRKD